MPIFRSPVIRSRSPPCGRLPWLDLPAELLPHPVQPTRRYPSLLLSHTERTSVCETTVWPVRADAPRGSYAGLLVHHTARAMPAISDVRPLLPVPVLAPREAPGTPASYPCRLRTVCRACAYCSPSLTASLNLRGNSHGE